MTTTTNSLKYSLRQFHEIANSQTVYDVPKDVCEVVNYLSSKMGLACTLSEQVIKQPTSILTGATAAAYDNDSFGTTSATAANKGKKKHRNKEATDSEWDTIRSFQTTKLEQKTGIDADINELRMFLNKITDKTFLDMRQNIISKIEQVSSTLMECGDPDNHFGKMGLMLYEVCSSNKFYSKIFADLYAELATTYKWVKKVFKTKSNELFDMYTNIKYVDPDKDYDGFCEMNKINERRRAITTFYLNLALNKFIRQEMVVKLLATILTQIVTMIPAANHKNEVDELTEHVGALYNKSMIQQVDEDAVESEEFYVLGQPIIDTVNDLAKKKAKDYPSLSSKSIFKFMDLTEL